MMGRTGSVVLIAVVLCGVFGGSVAVAQDATPVVHEAHPIIGSWQLDTDISDPTNPITLAVFTSDGVYFQADAIAGEEEGTSVAVGSWEATGETTGNLTFVILTGTGLSVVIRASVDATEADTLTANYTSEVVMPDGTSSGEVGVGLAEGTRILVEPQGEPIGSFEDVFGAPEATPAG